MLWRITSLAISFALSCTTIAYVPCSSVSRRGTSKWPNIPFDCTVQSNNDLHFTHVGAPLPLRERQQSERMLGRFRHFSGKADPHFSKLPVRMLSDQMELEWEPDHNAQGLGFSSYTSQGSHVFWSLERTFGFREATARWTAMSGQPGTFTLSRRHPQFAWPSFPFRAANEPPLRIVDFVTGGVSIVRNGDKADVETLLEERFPQELFQQGHSSHWRVYSPSRRYQYTVRLLNGPYFQDSMTQSTVWYAHQSFVYSQWQFGFRTAAAALKNSKGEIVCTMALDTNHLSGIGVSGFANTSDTS